MTVRVLLKPFALVLAAQIAFVSPAGAGGASAGGGQMFASVAARSGDSVDLDVLREVPPDFFRPLLTQSHFSPQDGRSISQSISELEHLYSQIDTKTAQSTPAVQILSPQEKLEKIENLLAIVEIVDTAISMGLYKVPGGSFVYNLSKTVGLYAQAPFYNSESVWQEAHSAALSTVLQFVQFRGGENAVKAELLDAGLDADRFSNALDELLD